MIFTIFLMIATAFIALNGLLYQPKKDKDGPSTWKNINLTGKVLFIVILAFSVISIIQAISEEQSKQHEIASRDAKINQLIVAQKELKHEVTSRDTKIDELLRAQTELKDGIASRDAKIDQLLLAQSELKDINNHLIKVMSVADGYNALIRGVLIFRQPVSEFEIRETLEILFSKAIQIDLSAENKLGTYIGRIDYSANPEIKKFLRISNSEDSEFDRYNQYVTGTTYFYEIRFSGLKILNEQNIQYARMNPSEQINVHVEHFDWARDFQRLYSVETIVIGELVIEELEEIQLDIEITWDQID